MSTAVLRSRKHEAHILVGVDDVNTDIWVVLCPNTKDLIGKRLAHDRDVLEIQRYRSKLSQSRHDAARLRARHICGRPHLVEPHGHACAIELKRIARVFLEDLLHFSLRVQSDREYDARASSPLDIL